MSQTFTNIGPIYTTQAKYDALVQAGTVELGREYVIVDAHGEVYDIQINGTSILSNGVANITDSALSQVKYTSQSLTSAQKTQARTNIAAIAMEEYNPSATSYEEGVIYYTVEA